MRIILICLFCLSLGACSAIAPMILDKLTGSGMSVDAQIGDENAHIGNTISDVEGENVEIDQSHQSFSGAADEVLIQDTNYLGLGLFTLVGLLIGLVVGIFIDRERIGL